MLSFSTKLNLQAQLRVRNRVQYYRRRNYQPLKLCCFCFAVGLKRKYLQFFEKKYVGLIQSRSVRSTIKCVYL